MSYHTEIMLFEILNLNYTITGNPCLKLDLLEDTFYTLQDLLNNKENLIENKIFEEELENLLDIIPEYITIEDNEIIINEDIDLAYDELLLKFSTLTPIDYDIQEYIQNIIVYRSLKLPIPLEETKEIFELNRKIIQVYLKAAEYDFNQKPSLSLIIYLKCFIDNLKDRLNQIDNTTLNKIKMCCAYYNNEYLEDSNEPFINSSWNIILFSNNERQLLSLSYDKIEYLCSIIDCEMNEENEYILNEFLDTEDDELDFNKTEYNDFEEIPYFLTHFLIHLNKFIINNRNNLKNEIVEKLIIKKYFLLSIPELENFEEHYLEHFTIDTLEAPTIPKEWLTASSFEILLPKVTECALSLDFSDKEITYKPYLYSRIVINSLFIKCFLNLSINENDKNNIISLITNSRYYKDEKYTITSNLIDELIFNDNLNLSL